MTGIHSSDALARAFGLSVAEKDRSVLAADEELGGSSRCVVLQTDAAVQHAVTFVQHSTEDSHVSNHEEYALH